MNKKIWKRSMQILGLIIILGMGVFSHKGNKSQKMVFNRFQDPNSLADCPDKPNCVSSFVAPSDSHYIAPLTMQVFNKEPIIKAIESIGCQAKTNDDNYLHFECVSNFFKFTDDLELLYSVDKKTLHFRSASRVGHSDLGANEKRVNKIKDLLSNL